MPLKDIQKKLWGRGNNTMNSENSHITYCASEIEAGMQLKLIDSLGKMFDFLASPNIEEKICSVGNCAGGTGKHKVASHCMEYSIICLDLLFLTKAPYYDPLEMFGRIEGPFLALKRRLSTTGFYHCETGVPEEHRWFAFIEYTKVANTLLKDVAASIKQHIKQQRGSLHSYIRLIASVIKHKITIYGEGYGMGSKVVDALEKHVKAIDKLYPIMDVFTSPNIEAEMEFSLACYAESAKNYIDILIESYNNEIQLSIIGDKELAVLQQWREMLVDVCFDDEEGFSKKQGWLDFVAFVNTVESLFEDAVKRYTEKMIKRLEMFMMETCGASEEEKI